MVADCKQQILIVDIDTRMPDGENQILNEKRIDYDANPFQSGGDLVSNAVFDHYLYGTYPPLPEPKKRREIERTPQTFRCV